LLVSQIPVELVRTVALDTSSMTSVALAKIIFENWLGGGRTFTPMEPDIEKMLDCCDAGLVIGDPALQVDRRRYHTLDLAEEWIRYTGKPFVFAFWAVRGDALREADPALDLAAVFRDSRDHGLAPESLDKISREWAPRVGLSEADIRGYLTDNIHYQLDAGCLEGLRLFYRYAAEIGALPAAPELQFVQMSRAFADS
jgi:chorismate dehydratase